MEESDNSDIEDFEVAQERTERTPVKRRKLEIEYEYENVDTNKTKLKQFNSTV